MTHAILCSALIAIAVFLVILMSNRKMDKEIALVEKHTLSFLSWLMVAAFANPHKAWNSLIQLPRPKRRLPIDNKNLPCLVGVFVIMVMVLYCITVTNCRGAMILVGCSAVCITFAVTKSDTLRIFHKGKDSETEITIMGGGKKQRKVKKD